MPAGARTKIPRPPSQRRKPERSDPPVLPPLVAKAAGDLVALAAAIRACPVCTAGDDRVVLGAGYPCAPVMLLSDKPSASDLDTGVALTDEAEALDKAFAGLGMSLSSVYGTTAVRTAKAEPCPDHLLAELEAVEPCVLVAFGPRSVDAIRLLDGRCGIGVPDGVPQGEPVALRPGLFLVATEPLPSGVTNKDAKRRLWRDLQKIPALIEAHR